MRTNFQNRFELSPIILTNGIASSQPNGMMPIIDITEGKSPPADPNDYFAHFRPLPGATLVDNEIGDYPFANQTVAANAIIARPLVVSLLMSTPANKAGGLNNKINQFGALKAALDQHNQSGGTYTVLTPSFIYTNCILTAMRAVDGGESKQVQHTWQLDFIKPLLTLEDAEFQYNALMKKIDGGLPIQGQPAWSGPDTVTMEQA